MRYSQINLKTKIFKVNTQDLLIEEQNIIHIQLVPTVEGRTEELKLEHSSLVLGVMNEFIYFNMDKNGEIIEEHPVYILDKELAKQELIVEKTNQSNSHVDYR